MLQVSHGTGASMWDSPCQTAVSWGFLGNSPFPFCFPSFSLLHPWNEQTVQEDQQSQHLQLWGEKHSTSQYPKDGRQWSKDERKLSSLRIAWSNFSGHRLLLPDILLCKTNKSLRWWHCYEFSVSYSLMHFQLIKKEGKTLEMGIWPGS